ncbi:hypothetical protein [Endozoicomonas sp. SCSIO W0465]|uniref:hypothetical protein n=1 Tax=Endozoicomonas sp. SCSIO W0465 TaxID=2918516 RepID=UPI00207592AF|nr:hypothetical protein [Endozoicomonas sp. SCSIO W0465]USE34329.1 hypothetical protein MJO57_19490 [Endozoicomonas sp. SCSIO W0465]
MVLSPSLLSLFLLNTVGFTPCCILKKRQSMMDRYEETAQKSGARIVHCSGFDSIPSDMGVYFTQRKAKEVLGSFCMEISMRVKAAKGGLSGGTLASMINITREAAKDSALRRQLANPYISKRLVSRVVSGQLPLCLVIGLLSGWKKMLI